MSRFWRRMMTDRVIIIFTALVVCAIVAIVILSMVLPDSGFDVPDEAQPPVDDASSGANTAGGLAGSVTR